jgi:hypothetical protein
MTGLNPFKKLGTICLTVFLLAAPQIYAQDDLDDFGGLDDLGGDSAVESPATPDAAPAAGRELGDGMVAESPAGAAADTSKMSETEQIDALISKFTFATENPKKDPFRPIVEKKVVLPPVRTVQPVARPQDTKPAPPPVKPIRLFVTGIVGNEGQRLAVVKFENNEYTITKDQIVEGKFKVVDILSDRVVVYSNKEQRRHTFKIGGDEKD